MSSWTDKTIEKAVRDAKAGDDVWLTDAKKERGVGRLRLRANGAGGRFYYRYSLAGKQAQVLLGVYDSSGQVGLTLKEARAKEGELSKLYQSGVHDLHAYLAQQKAEEAAMRAAAKREREEAERQAASGSLKALCEGYISHLERLGKSSAKEARNLFKRNIFVAFPSLAATRSQVITHRDVNAVLATLIDAGKGRTAGKLRSYLRAAFSAAMQAEYDPGIHPQLHGFNLEMNPVAAVPAKTLARYNRVGERVLNETELRGFMAALEQQEDMYADAITLALYLGGQRIAQLLRLRPADADLDAGTVTLFDPKGARQIARVHVLPLNEKALGIVTRTLAVNGHKPFLFTLRKVPVRPEKLSAVVAKISAAMVKAETAREAFQLRDIRRTCETMLAKMGISSDVRAQLLSHGLGGVQIRHYDRHSYMDEKRAALDAWAARLEEIISGQATTNVVPLRR